METTTMADAATAYLDGREFRMLIGGDFVQGGSGQTAPVTNPSTGEAVTRVPIADAADVDRAVVAAKAAQPAWEALGVEARGECMLKFAQLVRENREDLAMLDAGFKEARFYWEGINEYGEGDGDFQIVEHGEDCESWVAYLVGVK